MIGLREGSNKGKSLGDIFDYTNAGDNFSNQINEKFRVGAWHKTMWSTVFMFENVNVKVTIMEPIFRTEQRISRRRTENIYGPTESRYIMKADNKPVAYPFIYRFLDKDMYTVAKFSFSRTGDKDFQNFVNFMISGKEEYLFK
jgi:hypothetical protein